jgi:hypothetical protein
MKLDESEYYTISVKDFAFKDKDDDEEMNFKVTRYNPDLYEDFYEIYWKTFCHCLKIIPDDLFHAWIASSL